MDNEVWRWLWTAAAVGMGIGEAATAGFFLLPFAIGAAVAAVLAWVGIPGLIQWLAFFAATGVSFWYVRRFAKRQDQGEQEAIGANRWLHARGTALTEIDGEAGTGMVKLGSEDWRATTDGPPIPEGKPILVVEVRGTRLVVLPDVEIDQPLGE